MEKPLLRACALVAIAISIAGCSATAMRERGLDNYAQGKSERMLLLGIQSYEDGNLKKAAEHFDEALNDGLTFTRDKVTAYKYLAFIDCSTGRERLCRDNFVAALALDPDMQLSPAEAGHPVWGPIFKSVKARTAREGN